LGVAYSSPPIIQILNNIKAPSNISTPTAALAMRALSPAGLKLLRANIATLNSNRTWLHSALLKLPSVLRILGAGDANFLLVQIGTEGAPDNVKAQAVYTKMAQVEKVVVRFRGNESGCEGCVRITVGTMEECETVIEKLGQLLQ
jgi:histidinol-phosphate aminotransferase